MRTVEIRLRQFCFYLRKASFYTVITASSKGLFNISVLHAMNEASFLHTIFEQMPSTLEVGGA